MATTYYVWSKVIGSDKDENPVTFDRGEKVTQTTLNVSSTEFQAMVDSGAIRPKPYPAPDDFNGSAVDYLREQLREATSVSESSVEEAEALHDLSELEKVSG